MSGSVHERVHSPALANRLILLGASNLTMSLYTVIELLQQRVGGPSDVLIAAGHGRSYGEPSQIMFRELPGIISSGLWKRLDRAIERPTYALLTDIGNDIPYGYTAQQILGWVNCCVNRLQRQAVHVVVTNVPIASIETISEWRYKILRPLLFPSCRLSRNEVIERARAVHQGLVEMAVSKRFELLELSSDWLGSDAIHIRIGKRSTFYRYVAEQFPASREIQCSLTGKKPWLSILGQRPRFAYKKVFGQEQYSRQPSAQLTDGTIISMY